MQHSRYFRRFSQRTLTYFVRGSIIVRLTSSLTGSDSIKQVNLHLMSCLTVGPIRLFVLLLLKSSMLENIGTRPYLAARSCNPFKIGHFGFFASRSGKVDDDDDWTKDWLCKNRLKYEEAAQLKYKIEEIGNGNFYRFFLREREGVLSLAIFCCFLSRSTKACWR